MKLMGLSAPQKKKFTVNTTISDLEGKFSPRVFKIEEGGSNAPNQIWGGDITYLRFSTLLEKIFYIYR